MTTDRTDTTLADYVGIISRRKWFIGAVALVCAAAALGVSLLAKPTYSATASLNVRDPNQDLTLLGTAFVSGQTPLQLATAHASQIERPAVLQAAGRELTPPLAAAAVKHAVAVQVDPNSDLVEITAQARHADRAAAIATAVARQDALLTTAQARASYAAAAKKLSQRVRRLNSAQDAGTRAIYVEQLSRLQDLGSVATPVTINTSAAVPGSPSSPKPVRNTAAALVFGLLLGIALAFGRHRLDRRLRSLPDVEGELPYPIVGQIRASALGRTGTPPTAARNGTASLEEVDAESFRILRQNVRYLATDDTSGTILVTSSVASEGKSTVAACLAMASAAAGQRTLLVECDLRRPVLATRFGLRESPGLTDYLTGHASPREIMQMVATAAEPTGMQNGNGASLHEQLVCIVAGTLPPRPAELLGSQKFETFLSEVGSVYDVVVLDSPPLLAVADPLELIRHAGSVLMCVRLDQTTREQIHGAAAAMQRLPDRPTAVVLTSVTDRAGGYYGYYDRSPAPA